MGKDVYKRQALDTKQDLWFATKDTISKKYDHLSLIHIYCKASASGTRLTVANDAHNGNVPAGGFVRDVGFIVSGPADLAVVEYE